MTTCNDLQLENDLSVRFGTMLAQPPPGEEVVISGMSGMFPLATNIDEFEYNLENKVDMISQMPRMNPEMPTGFGYLKDRTRFDSGFFGVRPSQVPSMCPMGRLLLEKCYECLFDAGLHPSDLAGTRTGVFVGASFSESEIHWYFFEHVKSVNIILGNERSLLANDISQQLKLKGPSFTVDTACSSSATALDMAYQAIRKGECDSALVGGANLLLADACSLQFSRLGVLSKEGRCRPFDADGTGYVRAEALGFILLQKAKDANRIYATVIHAKSNCDGYKEQGITYPSGAVQKQLLEEVYLESGIAPSQISFLEAHGTGTPVGDPEEMSAIDEFFVSERRTPLLVGSVKSSIGHAEVASGICSIIKIILGFEKNKILPNINYERPRPSLLGVVAGRLKVVVENTPLPKQDNIAGLSSFGFGGANTHIILKQATKRRLGRRQPEDTRPRLVCVSGRTEEAVHSLLDDIGGKFDEEQIALVQNVFRKPINNHIWRGYIIVSHNGVLQKSVKERRSSRTKFFVHFGGISKVSGNALLELLQLPGLAAFKSSLEHIFSESRLDLTTIVSDLGSFLRNALVQVALAELLKLLGVEFDMVTGESLGKFGSSYFKNILTLNEYVKCMLAIDKEIGSTKKSHHGIKPEDLLTPSKIKFLGDFTRILDAHKHVNGFGSHQMTTALPQYFAEAVSEPPRPHPPASSKNVVILELGQNASTVSSKCTTLDLYGQDNLMGVLDVLGRLYEHGRHPQVQLLYPKLQFPVSRGTPGISSKIKWKHDKQQVVITYACDIRINDAGTVNIDLEEYQWTGVDGHVIDGRNLFPATGYLYIAWSLLAKVMSVDVNNLRVVFENCKFLRACTLSKTGHLDLEIMMQKQTGNFEITDNNVPVVTGCCRVDESDTVAPEFDLETDTEEALNAKDIYKELRLRGYNYKGLFRGIVGCNKSATSARIKWADNWIAFMDNMLQMQILQEDTRMLYVPTGVRRLRIDPYILQKAVVGRGQNEDSTVDLPITFNRTTGVIKCPGVEIAGLLAASIPRKKTTAIPVLEKYVFVPNEGKLALPDAVRVFMQILLENYNTLTVSAVELVDGATEEGLPLLGQIMKDALDDLPLIHTDITLLSAEPIDTDLDVVNKRIADMADATLVIASKILSRPLILQQAIQATKKTAFLISREPRGAQTPKDLNLPTMDVISVMDTGDEKLVLLRKKANHTKSRVFVNINNKKGSFSWLQELKTAIKTNQDVVVWCQNEPLNGILGLVNCLRREPDCEGVRGLFIVDKAPEFAAKLPFYTEQLDKQLAVNVYQKGAWGTYRHLLLGDLETVESEHCFANSTVRGDLSSIKWIEGPLSSNVEPKSQESLVEVYYSSLNFRDVMTASGKINVDVITKNRREQECVQGFEFSGKTLRGNRVMGMTTQGSLATLVKADPNLLWQVPQSWSLKDAATVPVVYGTCLYALEVVGKMKRSDSVLIHSGTGGIGQAAINLCLAKGCTVFTTVGTEEKREFLKKHFPRIKESHIGNSRDVTFEQMIQRETDGKGVDIILNSLAEDKLIASARCLARNGRFLEIGKFDLANDNPLRLLPFKEGGSYHGVMLDKMFNESDQVKQELNLLVQKFIDSGVVKPLSTTVFAQDEVEQAFRFMTTGRHMGKVLVEIRNEHSKEARRKFRGLPRYFCDPSKSYVICGGLGGFGLELADWLVLRGAKNLVLTSRKGISTGYQSSRIALWKSYGCNIQISTQNITVESGCEAMLHEATALAPVKAIFNLAVVLQDAILDNQTEQTFKESFGPKAVATQYLDEATRRLCPELSDFVIFSSVSCGRGNAGQTNYGMSNSTMERICEKRRRDGYPAVAIQWGAIGDVGLVAQLQEEQVELEIGGTLQQSITSCLQVLDVFLRQTEASIVSSMVVAEKKIASLSTNILDGVGSILGLRDIKTVSLQSTLAELGMDSMNGVEVKQTLEREYDILLSASELRSITLARILELHQNGNNDAKAFQEPQGFQLKDLFEDLLKQRGARNNPTGKLKSLANGQKHMPEVIAFPGIEGHCMLLETLTKMLEVNAAGINYTMELQSDSIPETATRILPYVTDRLQPHQPFHLLAHSLGSTVALEVASHLERLGFVGTITFIDGSPSFMKKLISATTKGDLETATFCGILFPQLNGEQIREFTQEMSKCKSADEKFDLFLSKLKYDETFTRTLVSNATTTALNLLKACLNYQPTAKLKSQARLFKPTLTTLHVEAADYELGQYFEQPVEVMVLEGDHRTILQNKELAENIMRYLRVDNGPVEE